MRVLLVGYGSMGRELERVLEARGHRIVSRVDPAGGGDQTALSAGTASQAEVAIEFAHPSAVLENARLYAQNGLNAVVGTTGWQDQREQVAALVEQSDIAYLHGPNFSVGVHMFYRIVAAAARLVDRVDAYDVLAMEMHHSRKKDSPSGTAHALAKLILENVERKKRLVTQRLDRAIEPEELHFASVRGGNSPGQHGIILDSPADTIELTHTARSRAGFALGAVLAAEWLPGRKGFLSVDSFVQDTLGDDKT